jgi:hypothetical protein
MIKRELLYWNVILTGSILSLALDPFAELRTSARSNTFAGLSKAVADLAIRSERV